MSTVTKWMLFIGATFPGHEHDYTMLKNEFSPEQPWFEIIRAWLDSGYPGILKDYLGDNIEIPHKKPRKSKKSPDQNLRLNKRLKIRR
jgi:hypothetical protein